MYAAAPGGRQAQRLARAAAQQAKRPQGVVFVDDDDDDDDDNNSEYDDSEFDSSALSDQDLDERPKDLFPVRHEPSSLLKPDTPDADVIKYWHNLERLINIWADELIVTHLPNIDTTHNAFPFEAFTRHSFLAGPIVRNPKYAKYIFQLSIWNILNRKYLGHLAIEWACEDYKASWASSPTLGLAEVIYRLTSWNVIPRNEIKRMSDREAFYNWRIATVDYMYSKLLQEEDYRNHAVALVADIIAMYTGCFQERFGAGSLYDWEMVTGHTENVVVAALELGIMMRRSRDGTWSPFLPIRGSRALAAAVVPHEDRGAALPPGQAEVRADSAVTMCVVPGLCKYEMRQAPDDPAHPGEKMSQIFKRVRLRAKCLIDLTEEETGPKLPADEWEPEDL